MTLKLATLLPNLTGGCAEHVATNLAHALVDRGYSVDLIVLEARGALVGTVNPGVRVGNLNVKRVRSALLPPARYLRNTRPGAVLGNMWPLTVVALWARQLARWPTRMVWGAHTTWSRSELLERLAVGWQVRATMHRLFPKVDGIAAVSRGAADDLARFANLDRKAVSVIYNAAMGAAKPRASAPLAPAEWWTGPHSKVLLVSTLKRIKEHRAVRHAGARVLNLGAGQRRAALGAR